MSKSMNERLKMAYLILGHRDEKNRTRYQRAKYLSERNDLYLFVWRNTEIPEEIEGKAKVMRSHFDLKGFLFLLQVGWCVSDILKLNRKTQINLIYTFYDPLSTIEGFILKLLGYKWIADLIDHPDLPYKMSKKKHLFFFKICSYMSRKILRHADLVISAILPEALKEYNIDSQKIFPVTNGVNLNITKPKGAIRAGSTFRIFYVGYVRKDIGMDTLLSSIAILKDKISSLMLTLVGDTDEEDRYYLDQTIKSLDLEKHVDFRGVLSHDEVLYLEECSDICIFPFPEREELDYIYPIKILEYLAMGKVVVATNLKGVRTIIKDGENGLLVEPDNPEDMAMAILKIYKDLELRKKIESNARESVEKYDWDKINERIDKKLKEVVQKHG